MVFARKISICIVTPLKLTLLRYRSKDKRSVVAIVAGSASYF